MFTCNLPTCVSVSALMTLLMFSSAHIRTSSSESSDRLKNISMDKVRYLAKSEEDEDLEEEKEPPPHKLSEIVLQWISFSLTLKTDIHDICFFF